MIYLLEMYLLQPEIVIYFYLVNCKELNLVVLFL